MNVLIAATASINMSIKAQGALRSVGIYSQIVSLPPEATRRGCAWGIQFDRSAEQRARSALRRAGVRVSQFIDGSRGGLP